MNGEVNVMAGQPASFRAAGEPVYQGVYIISRTRRRVRVTCACVRYHGCGYKLDSNVSPEVINMNCSYFIHVLY